MASWPPRTVGPVGAAPRVVPHGDDAPRTGWRLRARRPPGRHLQPDDRRGTADDPHLALHRPPRPHFRMSVCLRHIGFAIHQFTAARELLFEIMPRNNKHPRVIFAIQIRPTLRPCCFIRFFRDAGGPHESFWRSKVVCRCARATL